MSPLIAAYWPALILLTVMLIALAWLWLTIVTLD
jgi:hypothetical protein